MRPKGITHFSAFTIKYTGKVDRITTNLSIFKAFDPQKPPKPLYPLHRTQALWDTGATRSVITEDTVQKLGLVATGAAEIAHAGGTERRNTYLVNFFLPNNVGGLTWMTFRTPSIQSIDYVVEANRIRYAGVGRNNPCPCGKKDSSGKPVKFKHCHGRTIQ